MKSIQITSNRCIFVLCVFIIIWLFYWSLQVFAQNSTFRRPSYYTQLKFVSPWSWHFLVLKLDNQFGCPNLTTICVNQIPIYWHTNIGTKVTKFEIFIKICGGWRHRQIHVCLGGSRPREKNLVMSGWRHRRLRKLFKAAFLKSSILHCCSMLLSWV